jgi:hypothetical protein
MILAMRPALAGHGGSLLVTADTSGEATNIGPRCVNMVAFPPTDASDEEENKGSEHGAGDD